MGPPADVEALVRARHCIVKDSERRHISFHDWTKRLKVYGMVEEQ
jgi:hypothetical protein